MSVGKGAGFTFYGTGGV